MTFSGLIYRDENDEPQEGRILAETLNTTPLNPKSLGCTVDDINPALP